MKEDKKVVKSRLSYLALFLVILVLSLLIVWKGLFFVFLLLLLLVIWLLSSKLEWGWYILVFLSPMIHWVFRFDRYWYLFEGYPSLIKIYAPMVEFWVIFMLAAYGLSLARQWAKGEEIKIYLPGIGWFLLFVGSALLSIVNVYPTERWSSVWYLLRFIIFFYLGYIVLGVNVIKDKNIWRKSLKVGVVVAGLAALMGISSIVFGEWQQLYSFPRVTPFSLGSFMPFGDQHIFLAEIFTTFLPVLVYFWYTAKDEKRKFWWGTGTIIILLTALGTLSRAGWLTIFAQVIILAVLLRQTINWQKVKKFWWLLFCFLPLLIYFGYFLSISNLVQSSNATRWTLTELSWDFFKEHPVIGNGVGTFVNKLGEVTYYLMDFGEPTDAHGLGQKLLAEQGLLGLLTFLVFIFWILQRLYWRYKDERYTVEARLVAFVSLFLVLSPFIFQLFNTQYYTSRMWVPIALAIAQCVAYKSERIRPVFSINFKGREKRIEKEI